MKQVKFSIDADTRVEYCDEGQFRNFQLITEGDNVDQLLDNAQISEVDQDGGELDTYPLDDARSDVIRAANKIIMRVVEGRKP